MADFLPPREVGQLAAIRNSIRIAVEIIRKVREARAVRELQALLLNEGHLWCERLNEGQLWWYER